MIIMILVMLGGFIMSKLFLLVSAAVAVVLAVDRYLCYIINGFLL